MKKKITPQKRIRPITVMLGLISAGTGFHMTPARAQPASNVSNTTVPASHGYAVEIGIKDSTGIISKVIPGTYSNLNQALTVAPIISFRLLATLGVEDPVSSNIIDPSGKIVARESCSPATSTPGGGTSVSCIKIIGSNPPELDRLRLTGPFQG